mmetsp:Transcript_4941/g.13805  ORF Transcript_4941/g.13805 Transcript_4941/m.13805 type:complete len:236 (+) Transcript_4941:1399-2106(+)
MELVAPRQWVVVAVTVLLQRTDLDGVEALEVLRVVAGAAIHVAVAVVRAQSHADVLRRGALGGVSRSAALFSAEGGKPLCRREHAAAVRGVMCLACGGVLLGIKDVLRIVLKNCLKGAISRGVQHLATLTSASKVVPCGACRGTSCSPPGLPGADAHAADVQSSVTVVVAASVHLARRSAVPTATATKASTLQPVARMSSDRDAPPPLVPALTAAALPLSTAVSTSTWHGCRQTL